MLFFRFRMAEAQSPFTLLRFAGDIARHAFAIAFFRFAVQAIVLLLVSQAANGLFDVAHANFQSRLPLNLMSCVSVQLL